MPPPEPIGLNELVSTSIPDAWKDGKTNALAIITALSANRGKTLPWSTVKSAIDSGIRARWIEWTPDSGPWPCDITGRADAVIQVPKTRKVLVVKDGGAQKQLGTVTASDLEANGIQDLADQIRA